MTYMKLEPWTLRIALTNAMHLEGTLLATYEGLEPSELPLRGDLIHTDDERVPEKRLRVINVHRHYEQRTYTALCAVHYS